MFRLEFSTDNAAFADGNTGDEIARILFAVATKMQDADGQTPASGVIRDTNGNRIGEWSFWPSVTADNEGED